MQNRCNAKTKSGKPCQNFPVEGRNRCRMHGGNQKRGTDHHHFRHGLYSKYASESLHDVLSELEGKEGEDLINPQNELRLLEALILASKALGRDHTDLEDLETISRIVDRLIFAKQRSQKVMIEQKALIPATDVSKFLDYLDKTLQNYVPDSSIKIMNEIKSFKIS